MLTYVFDDPKQYNEILQFLALFLLFVIGCMIFLMSQKTSSLQRQISDLEMECPACPEIPTCPENKQCPACPQCPSLTCSDDGKCPDCICPADDKCPTCPPCNANANCPSVEDIVGGIFPGRNTGITQSGKYFDIQNNEGYELMTDYSFYDAKKAFPSDSILTGGNIDENKNTLEMDSLNVNTNTVESKRMNNQKDMPELGEPEIDDFPRMSRSSPGVPGNGSNSLTDDSGVPSASRSLSP